jgi:hypothetical protein
MVRQNSPFIPGETMKNITETKLGRREALQVFGVGASLLALEACTKDTPAPIAAKPVEPPKPAEAPKPAPVAEAAKPAEAVAEAKPADGLDCKTKAPIDDASAGLRRALQYKETAADPAKVCSKCAQFEAAKFDACGGCKLFTGAVNPNGGCLSFAPKA